MLHRSIGTAHPLKPGRSPAGFPQPRGRPRAERKNAAVSSTLALTRHRLRPLVRWALPAASVLVLAVWAGTASGASVATQAIRVTLTAPTHTPKVGVRWPYVVRASSAGKPIAGRITVQIVDPIGGVHPVEFDKSTKKVTNWPFKGTFRDWVIWPLESRGVPLTFRVIVRAGKVKRVLDYRVTSRS
jgi:hypothetical protein